LTIAPRRVVLATTSLKKGLVVFIWKKEWRSRRGCSMEIHGLLVFLFDNESNVML
jgi:hypothetical protein